VKIPLAYSTIPASRNETGIIIQPLDASNLTRVVLKSIFWWALSSIEFVHRDGMLIGACEQMSTIGEPDLTA
jgi:hypothetical protein